MNRSKLPKGTFDAEDERRSALAAKLPSRTVYWKGAGYFAAKASATR